jgi:succinoglycan biosynthesis protein ExoA
MVETCVDRRAPAGNAAAVTEERPFVSVIVPVRNEEAFIESTLRQLLRQNYHPFEVLVADGQSTDATPEIVRRLACEHANLRLVANPGRWSSAGRNAALGIAQGDIVVIVDGHCDVDDSDHLSKLLASFDHSGADCVGRPQPLDVRNATLLQRAIAAARSSRLGHNPSSCIFSATEGFVPPDSVAVAYRRSVFDTVGVFDDTFDACEDVEFNYRVSRAGLRCFFTPRVAVHYYPRARLSGLFRQMARYGRGRVRLLRKHPETFSFACFLPALFLLGLVAGPLFAWHSAWLAAAYAIAVAVYGAAILATSIGLSLQTRDPRLLPWLPLVFVAIHLGAGAGVLRECVSGGRSDARREWRVQEQLP